jgi:myo-inositol catabolism protein IolH
MKLTLDPQMFFATSTVWELPDIVASLGDDWMELSPKADFVPFFKYPRVDDTGVRKLKKVADAGVEVINTEFNGRPEAAEHPEAQFLKSLDELLPIFERDGIQLILEPHPDDFVEDGVEAVNLVRGLNMDWIGFLKCTPHPFHQGHDPATVISAGAEKVRYVHLADAWDHTASNGLRYITNPPGNPIRVHQQMEMGLGDVDYDAVFAALAAVRFDGAISSCVSERQRDKAIALVNQHFGEQTGASLTSGTPSTQAGI